MSNESQASETLSNQIPLNPLVLVIDDDSSDLQILSLYLKKLNLNFVCLKNPEEVIQILHENYGKIPTLVLSDIYMPSIDGFTLLKRILRQFPLTPVIFISGTPDLSTPIEALRLGASDYLRKPVHFSEFQVRLERAVERIQQKFEIKSLVTDALSSFSREGFVGQSPKIQEVFKTILKVSLVDSPVLLLGESGVGKERVARAIHDRSPRKQNEFVAVNCASIPENLLEAELFGYAKGAFTGADKDTQGLFEFADGGTLLLDEIGELPIQLQAKLLRTLQEKEIKPLGSKRSKKVNVRIIAATHQNLQTMIQEKKFREDLYFRLNVIPIHIPALRDRKEDLDLLISYFLRKANEKWQLNKTLSVEAREKLKAYDWPGNIREMENNIERAFILSDHNEILASDFELHPRTNAKNFFQLTDNDLPTLYEVEFAYIQEILKRTHSKEEAARILGIGRKTLYRKELEVKSIEPSSLRDRGFTLS